MVNNDRSVLGKCQSCHKGPGGKKLGEMRIKDRTYEWFMDDRYRILYLFHSDPGGVVRGSSGLILED